MSYGWTSPTFTDFIASASFMPSAIGQYVNQIIDGTQYPIVPSGQVFVLNVITPEASASVLQGEIIIQGMYV